jgi:thiol-disulfide isomerase/thioredoxin
MLVLAGFTALVIVVIAALAVFSATGDGAGAGNFTPNDEGLIPVGEMAPGFTAETVGGGSVSVGEGEALATILVFFATWCPHCNNEAPILSELEGQYDGLKRVMVGIDGEDDAGKVQGFVQEYGIESPAVHEPSLGPSTESPATPRRTCWTGTTGWSAPARARPQGRSTRVGSRWPSDLRRIKEAPCR